MRVLRVLGVVAIGVGMYLMWIAFVWSIIISTHTAKAQVVVAPVETPAVAAVPTAPALTVSSPYFVEDGVGVTVLVFPDSTDMAQDVDAAQQLGTQITKSGRDGVVLVCKEGSQLFTGDAHDCVGIFYFRRPVR